MPKQYRDSIVDSLLKAITNPANNHPDERIDFLMHTIRTLRDENDALRNRLLAFECKKVTP